jgi:hypothetical protein
MSEKTSFYPELERNIRPADGKLGVLLPGMGAVATTFIAGTLLARKGLAQPRRGYCTTYPGRHAVC